MTYEEAINLLDLESLRSFESNNELWKNWGANFDWKNPFGITDKINTLIHNIQDIWIKVKESARMIWDFIADQARDYFKWLWDKLGDFIWHISEEFKKLILDPRGWFWNIIESVVKPLINGIKSVGINIWEFAKTLWNNIWGWLEPKITSLQNVITGWIDTVKEKIKGWIDAIKTTVDNIWNWITEKIGWVSDKLYNVWQWVTVTLSDELKAIKNSLGKTFDFGLGGLAESIKGFFENIFSRFWDWFTGKLSAFWNFVNAKFLQPFKAGAEELMRWLWESFQDRFRLLLGILKKFLPRSPEQGESMIWEGLGFLGMGAGILALMTLGGGLAKRISGADVPGLAAIIADFSGFRFITGAIMGGLVTAAYAQPLKYYYNALFRPYLPSWNEIVEAFGRSKISDSLFKFFLKYNGVDEKYFDIYKVLARRPISAFMIRYIADAEITDPEGIFRICMDNGYSPEHAGYMAFAMSWGANAPYRKAVESILQSCFKEGFISKSTMESEIEKVRATRTIHAVYEGLWGARAEADIKFPLDQKTLMAMAAEWKSFYDSTMDKVSALKTAYSKETITENELRAGLRDLGIVPNRIEDIVIREKAKKKGKTEPEKGKTLRDELKTVLRRAYQYGYITHQFLQQKIKDTNQVVDEETLIKERANWEAFIDDMKDWEAIYRENLENGLITEAEFRRDLIDMGFRPSKVELFIKYDRAKKEGRLKE